MFTEVLIFGLLFVVVFIVVLSRQSAPEKPFLESGKVRNWFGNEKWTPLKIEHPKSLADLVDIVKRNKGRKVRAVGSLHSWSRCAESDGAVMVKMENLNKVLEVVSTGPNDNLSVTAEAGIELIELYQILRKHNLALTTIPNDGEFLLGGCVSNGVHGTNSSYGTFSSLVEEITIVKSDGTVLVANKNDPLTLDTFETLVVAVGNVGIIYSVKLRAVPYYNTIVYFSGVSYDTALNSLEDIMGNGGSTAMVVFPRSVDLVLLKSQKPVHKGTIEPGKRLAATEICTEMFLYRTGPYYSKWNFMSFGSWLVSSSFGCLFLSKYYPMQVTTWYDGEILVRRWKNRSFLSLEYALPLEKTVETVKGIHEIFNRHGVHRRICLRPVGPDTHGYLSPTKGRKTVFIDLQYSLDPVELKIYKEVENLFVQNGGRCAWSRKFASSGEEVRRNYPEVSKWIENVKKLDPDRMFSNDFSMQMFGI